MSVKFIDYGKDYLRFKREYDHAWEDVNERGDLILRKDIEEFEINLAEFVGTTYAVAVSSGTDALYLSLKALNVKGRVAVPSHTFKSTAGAIIDSGCSPFIYDLDNQWKFTKIVNAHIPVHIAGEVSYIPDVGIPVIEDACQAFGAIKNPTTIAQCWSFYPAKILGGKGDAGAVTTNSESVYEYIREARNHFKTDNKEFGGNYRMDNLQAALLNIKIKNIDWILARRKEIAGYYLQALSSLPLILPNNTETRVWQDFIIQTDKRDDLYAYLKLKGIETMKNEYPWTPQYPKLPLAKKYEAETLRIPCNENLTTAEVKEVIENIKDFYV